MRRFRQHYRGGLAELPYGHYVALKYGDRELLGEVIGAQYDEVLGVVVLEVKHFNGELWPIKPRAMAVQVLD